MVHRGVFTYPNQLAEDMELSWKDYIQLHHTSIPTFSAILIETKMKWIPPPVEWCKVNWDVAFQQDIGRLGVGVIVQDHNGRVLAASSFTKRGVMDKKTRETIASYVIP